MSWSTWLAIFVCGTRILCIRHRQYHQYQPNQSQHFQKYFMNSKSIIPIYPVLTEWFRRLLLSCFILPVGIWNRDLCAQSVIVVKYLLTVFTYYSLVFLSRTSVNMALNVLKNVVLVDSKWAASALDCFDHLTLAKLCMNPFYFKTWNKI
jgi:hypothetical protein